MNDKAAYWLELCDDDLITAKLLFKMNRLLHMGFFCHMVVEKSLKAVIADKLGEMPPKIHDLPKLADRGGLWGKLSGTQKSLIKTLIPLQIECRYPEYKDKINETLTIGLCEQMLKDTEEFLCWIKQQLGR